jgi:hypothetical protein
MGRYSGGGKNTTSGMLFLDVRYLQRNGFLRFGSSSSQRWSRRGEPFGSINLQALDGEVILSYRTRRHDGEDWTSKEYPVSLEWTRCNYGGERVWFRCPAASCGRRVAILYGGSIFACRQCHRLAYDSQHETRHGRMLLKAQAIRQKLGGTPCIADDFPQKPKGMHWRTYYSWRQKADEAEDRSWPPWVYKMMSRTPD